MDEFEFDGKDQWNATLECFLQPIGEREIEIRVEDMTFIRGLERELLDFNDLGLRRSDQHKADDQDFKQPQQHQRRFCSSA